VPGRNCQQAQILLHHLSQNRKVWGGRHGKQLWLSFIDYKAAFDHVDRRALWSHLRCMIGVSDVFLLEIQSMYDDDAYILQDGGKVTGRVNPSRGVKQGVAVYGWWLLWRASQYVKAGAGGCDWRCV
jgi:hypothetical protein